MNYKVNKDTSEELDGFTILLHAGLMVFGVLAWLTGLEAGDYKKIPHTWFSLHKWLGMGLTTFLALRLGYGFWGPDNNRFTQWLPYTSARLGLVFDDIRAVLSFKLPQRSTHQGLAGLWEAFGLVVFTWMAATGTYLFLFLQPGQKAGGLLHLVKELHEIGEWLVPIFLAVHVGAVIWHALSGDQRWRKMLFLK